MSLLARADGLAIVEELVGLSRVQACKPPRVPVPRPGPCPSAKNAAKKALGGNAAPKAVPKKAGGKTARAKTALADKPQGPDVVADTALAASLLDQVLAQPDVRTRWGTLEDDTGGDPLLSALSRQQGFDVPMQRATREQFAQMRRDGQIGKVLYRGVQQGGGGVTAAQIMEQTRSGPLRGGPGTFGNGLYLAAGRAHAGKYADGSPDSLGTFGLRKDARVVDYEQLSQEFDAWFHQSFGPDADWQVYEKRPEYAVYGDIGRYAAARGYDVISVRKGQEPGFGQKAAGNQYVILNRGALIAEEPDES